MAIINLIRRSSSRGPAPLLALALLCCCALAGGAAAAPAADAQGWIQGRATFYDDNKQGSCQYKDQIPELYAAWPDTLEGFKSSCGRCLEVACVDRDFSDGYGERLQRTGACYDAGRTVVVKIVDSCPCVHANYYSNKRWCCGDMKHIDLGRAAFRLLADEKWGVVGLKWRAVSCDRLGSSGRTAAPAAPAPVQQQKPQQQGQQWGQQQQAAPVQQQQPQQQQWRLALPQELATSPARSWGHGGGGEWQREAQRYASRYGGSGGGGARWGTPRIGRW